MNKNHPEFDKLLDRADKLFQKQKFGSARYHYFEALKICETKQIKEKIRICEENQQRMKKAQELLKEGYQWEKQKKYRIAVESFQQSLSYWENNEVRVKINSFKSKLPKTSLKPAYLAESEQRYEEAVKIYDQIFTSDFNLEAKKRKVICLVKMEAYEQAVEQFSEGISFDLDNAIKYYYGYALLKVGRYREGFDIWNTITSDQTEFEQQKASFVEFIVHELYLKASSEIIGEKQNKADTQSGDVLKSLYQIGLDMLEHYPSPLLTECLTYLKYRYIEKLWSENKFEEILTLLHSPPVDKSDKLYLFFCAKVYFRLLEKSGKYFKETITFWLTTIYNHRYLNNFFNRNDTTIDPKKISDILLEKLERQVYKYSSTLPREVVIHWELEKKAIIYMSKLAEQEDVQGEGQFSEYVCTPSYARLFGLSAEIVEIFEKLRSKFNFDEIFWEVGALFSSARESLVLLLSDKVDEAVSQLPRQEENKFVIYCRQRVFFNYGMKKLINNESNPKKYFVAAIPLIKKFKKYEREFIEHVQQMTELDQLIYVDEILQTLIKQVKSKELLEMASYVMSYKANALWATGKITAKTAEVIYQKAINMYSNNEFARNALEDNITNKYLDELESALNKGNMKKAANIAIKSDNQEIYDYFFDFAKDSLMSIDDYSMGNEQKIVILKHIYQGCQMIDHSHPCLNQIANKMERLGGKV